MQIKNIALFAASAAALAVEKRYPPDYCHRDNCFRNLLDKRFSASATPYCTNLLVVTSTQTEYTILNVPETVTSTPEVVTATEDATITVTVTTGTETITTYTTLPDIRYRKRSETDYPPWLSTSCVVSRVSSACSCFLKENSVAPLTVWETETITTATETITATETLPTLSETLTVTSTATDEVTETTTLPIGLKCGIKGCAKPLKVKDTKFNKTLSQCKAVCLADAQCESYIHQSTLKTCSIAYVSADDFYSPEISSLTPIICSAFKIYDRKC